MSNVELKYTEQEIDTIIAALDILKRKSYNVSKANGFWGGVRNKGEMIALMHSELSEMLEAVRKPGQCAKILDITKEEEEAADLLIRLLDYCEGNGLRLAYALIEKHKFNITRPFKHGKEF